MLYRTKRPVCSTEFIVYKPDEPKHKSFYYAAIDAPAFTAFFLAHVAGSTGSRQRTQPKATLAYSMPAPGTEAIEDFCAFADPIYEQIKANELESKRLEELHDVLLPRLMSGEIDVSKVDLTQLNSHLPKRWYVLLQIQGHPYIPATAATAVAQACVGTMKVWYFLEFGTTLGPLWSPDKEKGHKLEPVTWCFWSRGLDLNQRPPDYEDYLGAIQACYVPSSTHVMCVL